MLSESLMRLATIFAPASQSVAHQFCFTQNAKHSHQYAEINLFIDCRSMRSRGVNRRNCIGPESASPLRNYLQVPGA